MIEMVNKIVLLKKTKIIFLVGFFLVIILGYVDYIIGYALSFSLFYIIPISLVAWYNGFSSGIYISVLSTIAWYSADILARPEYAYKFTPYWNASIRFGFFLIITILLTKLHVSLICEKNLARKDSLTNTWNRLAFNELAQIEYSRAKRSNHVITLVYIDLDNFKSVNDKQGHDEGDKLLITVVNLIKKNSRQSDILARFGGDEFVLLLPESESETALVQINRIKEELLKEMKQNSWPVTFSIGMITFIKLEYTLDKMLNLTDKLMYKVKHNQKNDIIHEIIYDINA